MPRLHLSILLFFLASCSVKYRPYVHAYERAAQERPSYEDFYFWAAHPWKQDPSDSLPRGLSAQCDSLADVFFIHPTTYTKKRKEWNAAITDAALQARTDYSTILFQASAFSAHTRVFAPRYRQAHLDVFYTKDTTQAAAALDTAYADVRAAFLFYLQHYGKGRPLVIAGHSQGALLARRLLLEFFDGKPLQSSLVAAYIIGWPLPQGFFRNIPPCTEPGQVGCVASWRTFVQGYKPSYVLQEKFPAVVTNPLSWKSDSIAVAAGANRGAVLRPFSKLVPGVAGAVVDGNVIWTERPKFFGSLFLGRNLHIADINLYYTSIRENLALRIQRFLSSR